MPFSPCQLPAEGRRAARPRAFLPGEGTSAAPARGPAAHPTKARSSSREVRIPLFSVVYFSRGTSPPKKGKRALLGDLEGEGRGGEAEEQGAWHQTWLKLEGEQKIRLF